jgi:TPR repeat protein
VLKDLQKAVNWYQKALARNHSGQKIKYKPWMNKGIMLRLKKVLIIRDCLYFVAIRPLLNIIKIYRNRKNNYQQKQHQRK